MDTNLRHFKVWKFGLFFLLLLIISTVISVIFLGELSGLAGKAAVDVLMTGLLMLYIYRSVKVLQIELNGQAISGAMSLGRWAKYMGATLFVKVIGIFGASTLVLLFLLAFPSSIDAINRILLEGQLQPERPTMFVFLLMFVSLCIFTPIWEEFFFRGILFRRLALRYRTTTSAVVSSLVFGLLHFGGNSIFHAFLVGILFCYIYASTQNIWVPVILHGIGNFVSLLPALFPPAAHGGYVPTQQDLQEEILSLGIPLVLCLVASLWLLKRHWPKLRRMKVVKV
ncbi:MAG: lysostaphin resistance A-like protein [Lysinibacillus sp.]